RPALMSQLAEKAAVKTGLRATAVTDDGLLCIDSDGREELICADTVVLAAGLRPRRDEVDALRGTAPEVRVIGDCYTPANIRGATFNGYHAALDL
ncbi:MAG: NADH:flavin oxidoreductase, partial [Oscillospiraceae bacterium]|nr:NADH:flavin oxidoreductase [Oscillospiraceae bacterium]